MDFDYRRIRAAISELRDASGPRSGRGAFGRWSKASDESLAAYLLCFTEEERRKVIAAANERTDEERIDTFERAVELFGLVLIDEVLGPDGEES